MMLWLEIGKERFALRQGETTIGRSHYCTVVVDSSTASREHAAVRVMGERIELCDLGSRNGTAVNGQRISDAATIRVGDIITIGSKEIRLVEATLPDDASNTAESKIPSDPRPNTKTLPEQ